MTWSARVFSQEPVDRILLIALAAKSSGLLAGTCRVRLPHPGVMQLRFPRQEYPVETSEVVHGDARETEAELFLRLKICQAGHCQGRAVCRLSLCRVRRPRALREMARIRPCDRAQFATIPWVGSVRQEKYGPVFIDAIKAYCSDSCPLTIHYPIPNA